MYLTKCYKHFINVTSPKHHPTTQHSRANKAQQVTNPAGSMETRLNGWSIFRMLDCNSSWHWNDTWRNGLRVFESSLRKNTKNKTTRRIRRDLPEQSSCFRAISSGILLPGQRFQKGYSHDSHDCCLCIMVDGDERRVILCDFHVWCPWGHCFSMVSSILQLATAMRHGTAAKKTEISHRWLLSAHVASF